MIDAVHLQARVRDDLRKDKSIVRVEGGPMHAGETPPAHLLLCRAVCDCSRLCSDSLIKYEFFRTWDGLQDYRIVREAAIIQLSCSNAT